MTSTDVPIDWRKNDGLVPAIVQHAITGRVLMLGYMNAEALSRTQSSGLVTFFSRSRKCLWTKGETSGNKLEFRSIEIDCDSDTLLIQANPLGPTCHLQKQSCFDAATEKPGFGFIGELEAIIAARCADDRAGSYTAELMRAGTQRIAQKVGEEGVEVALAAMAGNPQELSAEVADLLYHLLVLLRHQDMHLVDAVNLLERRHNGAS